MSVSKEVIFFSDRAMLPFLLILNYYLCDLVVTMLSPRAVNVLN
jgi:hypothetical protein